jgi:hypothetical protein
MMKHISVLLFFLFSGGVIYSQDYQLLLTLTCSGKFTTDPIGNSYIYNKGDITKYNKEGYETARYSTREFGDITYVDASNPLKVLVVFREFSKAVVLDASLAANATIDLTFPGIPYVNVICSSRETGYWITDPVMKQIRKINDQLSIVADGTPYRQVTVSEIDPMYLVDSGDWIVLVARGYGLLVFDRFGTYYKTVQVIPDAPVQASGDEILFKEGTGMVKISIRTGKTDKFLLPENHTDDVCRVEGNRIFIKSMNTLKIYGY